MQLARRARTTQHGVRDLVLAVAAFSLLAMPVTYTGGAELPHPHVFFQVWIDVARGSFDHHHEHRDMASPQRSDAPAAPTISRQADPDAPSLDGATAPDTRELALVALVWSALALVVCHHRPRPNDEGARCGRRQAPELPPPRPAVPFRMVPKLA